jgi:hypothetical protein
VNDNYKSDEINEQKICGEYGDDVGSSGGDQWHS